MHIKNLQHQLSSVQAHAHFVALLLSKSILLTAARVTPPPPGIPSDGFHNSSASHLPVVSHYLISCPLIVSNHSPASSLQWFSIAHGVNSNA